MNTWLILCHAANHKDYPHIVRALRRMQKSLNVNVDAYVVMFGPHITSNASLSHIDSSAAKVLMTLPNPGGYGTVVNTSKTLISHLISAKVKIQAFCAYMHGAGFGSGVWKKHKFPFLTTVDLVKIFLDPFRPKLVALDSCYGGSMSCLYTMPRYVEFVVAASGFHPYTSLLWCKMFGILPDLHKTSKEAVGKYAHDLTCEWHKLAKAPYKCLLVFDTIMVSRLATYVKQHWDDLVFDERSRIDKEDVNLHDLFTAAQSVPIIRLLIGQLLRWCCKSCLIGVTKKVRGPSVERRLPKKWIEEYKENPWYKDIVQGKHGFQK